MDTGIAEHPDLNIAGGVSFIGDKTSYNDTHGHGTQMAGIIASSGQKNESIKGASPLAQLYAVKIVNDNGFANTATIMAGIQWAVENDMHIINMSFGTYFESKLLEKVIDNAAQNGVIMVGAVGNDGSFEDEYRIMYPAAYDAVIAVGAGSAYGVSSFSNNNEKLDFVAPGRLDSTDKNGEYTNVVGTSASAAYATGVFANLWSAKPQYNAEMILSTVKKSSVIDKKQENYVGFGELSLNNALTSINNYANITIKKEEIYNTSAYTDIVAKEISLALSRDNMPMEMAADNCFENEMNSAIEISIDERKSGKINCPGNEVWYKFTTINSDAHPNGGPGVYSIWTYGSLDTIGYLYDSSSNLVASSDDYDGDTNFRITTELLSYRTYYICIKAYGDNTGSFTLRVSPCTDDFSNTFETAHTVPSVYYEDQSIEGKLYNYYDQDDIDYFAFVPAEDCVMEIYTDGTGTHANTTGILYNECKAPIQYSSSFGNGNFKITAHLKAMQWYYISVGFSSQRSGYANYTLRFKFVKDYCEKPNLGSYGNPNYNNLRKYINWTPNSQSSFSYINGYIGATPVYETKTYIGRVWMNWSTAEHWNLHIIDNTQNNADSIMSTLGKYAAETITTEVLTKIVCTALSLSATASGPVGIVLGGVVTLFSSAIDSDKKDPEIQKFQNYARSITNNNTKWIMGEGINYMPGFSIVSDPINLEGTNKMTYEMENNSYFYGISLIRGTFSSKFAKAQ